MATILGLISGDIGVPKVPLKGTLAQLIEILAFHAWHGSAHSELSNHLNMKIYMLYAVFCLETRSSLHANF